MSRITGQQARELLELPDNAASWKIEQRNLAETLAWLYGREPDNEAGSHGGETYIVAPVGEGADAGMVASVLPIPLTPDEAVDLARALLAAAEE